MEFDKEIPRISIFDQAGHSEMNGARTVYVTNLFGTWNVQIRFSKIEINTSPLLLHSISFVLFFLTLPSPED